jgi:four helix bundle protein
MEATQTEKGYQKLLVHQKADELALAVYKETASFPKEEIFGITSQMRRAATSVPANIAEGYTRHHTNDKIRFYNVAQGSLVELEYFIDFSAKLGYISTDNYKDIREKSIEAGKLLGGYLRGIRNNIKAATRN